MEGAFHRARPVSARAFPRGVKNRLKQPTINYRPANPYDPLPFEETTLTLVTLFGLVPFTLTRETLFHLRNINLRFAFYASIGRRVCARGRHFYPRVK